MDVDGVNIEEGNLLLLMLDKRILLSPIFLSLARVLSEVGANAWTVPIRKRIYMILLIMVGMIVGLRGVYSLLICNLVSVSNVENTQCNGRMQLIYLRVSRSNSQQSMSIRDPSRVASQLQLSPNTPSRHFLP